MNSAWSNLIIGFLQDLLVTGGSIITGAMLATETVSMPSTPVIILAVLTGLIQAARRAQSKVDPSVVERAVRDPEIRTPAQLEAKARAREDTIDTIVARVTKAMQTPHPPVTPQRVEAAPVPIVSPPARVQKDSS